MTIARNNPFNRTDPSGLDCISSAGMTSCSYPSLGGPAFILPTPLNFPTSISSGNLLYHGYDVSAPIGNANQNTVMQALINNPTPGNPLPATPAGTSNNAVVFRQDNPVKSYLTTDLNSGNPLVVNMTGQNSLFSPEYVARTVSDDGVAHTYGEGLSPLQTPWITGYVTNYVANQVIWGGQMNSLIKQSSGSSKP